MARRHRAEKREILPDPKFGDLLLSKFMNVIMIQGKKSVAERIVYGALDIVKAKLRQNGVEVFQQVMEKLRPHLEVRSRRVGGATYQVPVEVREVRGKALAMRWLINAARGRSEPTMCERLAAELMAAFAGTGAAMKKREDTHRMAEANKAFSHYRW